MSDKWEMWTMCFKGSGKLLWWKGSELRGHTRAGEQTPLHHHPWFAVLLFGSVIYWSIFCLNASWDLVQGRDGKKKSISMSWMKYCHPHTTRPYCRVSYSGFWPWYSSRVSGPVIIAQRKSARCPSVQWLVYPALCTSLVPIGIGLPIFFKQLTNCVFLIKARWNNFPCSTDVLFQGRVYLRQTRVYWVLHGLVKADTCQCSKYFCEY